MPPLPVGHGVLGTERKGMPTAPEHLDLASKMGILFDQGMLLMLEKVDLKSLVESVEQLRGSDEDDEMESIASGT